MIDYQLALTWNAPALRRLIKFVYPLVFVFFKNSEPKINKLVGRTGPIPLSLSYCNRIADREDLRKLPTCWGVGSHET